MPPTTTGRPSAAGVTDRFAPKERSSRPTLSPTSSAKVATAAVTAMPRATAKTLSSLRRRRRASDSKTMRKIMRHSMKMLGGLGHRRGGNAQRVAFHAVVNVNGIASPRLADGGNVDRRATVAADHVLAVLVVALVPANRARVEAGAHRAGGIQDGDDANFRAPHVDHNAVQVMVGKQAGSNLRLAVLDAHALRRGHGVGGAGVDELRRYQHDHQQAGRSRGELPEVVALLIGQELAALGRR